MALPSSGPISLAQVRAELGVGGAISLGAANVRGLAGVGSGPISLAHLRGKSAVVGLGSFSLYAVNSQTSADFLDTGSMPGSYGSVSPGSIMGAGIVQIRINRSLYNGTYSYSIYFQLNTPGNTQTASVRGINIGGITIAGYMTQDQDLKGANLNTCSFKPTTAAGWMGGVTLSAAQWQAIYNAIVNQTTTVALV